METDTHIIISPSFYKTVTDSSGRKQRKRRYIAGPAVSVKQDAAAGPFFMPKTVTDSYARKKGVEAKIGTVLGN